MKKVSIGFTGLSTEDRSALVQLVVEKLASEGAVMIDRDDNGADITVLDRGDFVLPNGDTLTIEDGVPTIESDGFLSFYEAFKTCRADTGRAEDSFINPDKEKLAQQAAEANGFVVPCSMPDLEKRLKEACYGASAKPRIRAGDMFDVNPSRFVISPDKAISLIKIGRELEELLQKQ